MLIRILIAVAAVIVVFAMAAASRPADFTIARSTIVMAPPGVIYAQVADFTKWPAWSPWAKLDPNMKISYAGAMAQPGSTYEWQGNNKVGEGRMTMTSVRPPEMVDIKLEFLKPFPNTSQSVFNFVPSGPGTAVTWSMKGHNNFMAKAFSIFVDMDKMLGGDFERGLENLKTVSEAAAKAQATAPIAAPAPAVATPSIPIPPPAIK